MMKRQVRTLRSVTTPEALLSLAVATTPELVGASIRTGLAPGTMEDLATGRENADLNGPQRFLGGDDGLLSPVVLSSKLRYARTFGRFELRDVGLPFVIRGLREGAAPQQPQEPLPAANE